MQVQLTRPASGHVRLQRRKGGDAWYVKYRVPDGQQVQKRLGPAWVERGRPPAGYFTRRTAEAELRRILSDADRGTLAGARPGPGRSFGDACEEWLRYGEHEKQLSPSTLSDYRNVVRCYFLPEFGADTRLERITTERVDAWRERMLAEGRLSRRTVQKNLVLLHGVMRRAKRRKWIHANPVEDAERVTIRRSGDFNVLSPAEVLAVARAAGGEQDAAIFTVAAFTGLRLGELRALRWGDVDFSSSNLFVRRNLPSNGSERTPKSGKVRSVPLIDQAAAALDGLSRRGLFTGPEDRVFCSITGDPVADGPLRARFYLALKAAGLGHLREKPDPIVFHDLRHTFGTLAVQTWPLVDVQGYMGHADIQTTMIYAHHVPKRNAAQQLTVAVAAAVTSAPAGSAGIPAKPV